MISTINSGGGSFVPVVNENVSLVISRQLLTDFCSHLQQLEDVVAKQVAHFTLEKVQARVISFEEQVRLKENILLCFLDRKNRKE